MGLNFFEFFVRKISIKFQINRLKRIVGFIFVIIEKIVIKFSKFLPFYLDFYNEMIEKEIKMADITNNDKILHMGCGAVPATSLILNKKINAEITGIDNKLSSVKQAKKLFLKLEIHKNIKIRYANALDYDISSFDVVIVSQGLQPYKAILERLVKNMDKDIKLIVRTSSVKGNELEKNDEFLYDLFRVEKIVRQRKNGLLISILLFKK